MKGRLLGHPGSMTPIMYEREKTHLQLSVVGCANHEVTFAVKLVVIPGLDSSAPNIDIALRLRVARDMVGKGGQWGVRVERNGMGGRRK